ncbi:hypothetical protein PoB_005630100 [Plakobranchus ocellatus]|uniref:Secreted protein n=1 Tax=Plakobranchus ocellatus TaxID=259542 RepID=A0AAV4CAQ2_9GAST|nr:hypothetical protein PoB_005630100 [Plakobranchus ocellatus]
MRLFSLATILICGGICGEVVSELALTSAGSFITGELESGARTPPTSKPDGSQVTWNHVITVEPQFRRYCTNKQHRIISRQERIANLSLLPPRGLSLPALSTNPTSALTQHHPD